MLSAASLESNLFENAQWLSCCEDVTVPWSNLLRRFEVGWIAMWYPFLDRVERYRGVPTAEYVVKRPGVTRKP